MLDRKTSPVKSAFRYAWLGFAGFFVSVIAFGFAARNAIATIERTVGQLDQFPPDVIRSYLWEAALMPLPLAIGGLAVLFLVLFVAGSILFFVRALQGMTS